MWKGQCRETTFLSYASASLFVEIWGNRKSWFIFFKRIHFWLCRYHVQRTAYLQTPQQLGTFVSHRDKFGPGSQHLTLPRRSLHVQPVQLRKKSAGSCGVLFGRWLGLQLWKDTSGIDPNWQFLPGKTLSISDPAMLFFAAMPSSAYSSAWCSTIRATGIRAVVSWSTRWGQKICGRVWSSNNGFDIACWCVLMCLAASGFSC